MPEGSKEVKILVVIQKVKMLLTVEGLGSENICDFVVFILWFYQAEKTLGSDN